MRQTVLLLALPALATLSACAGSGDAGRIDSAATAAADSTAAMPAPGTAAGPTAEMMDSTGRALGTLTLAATSDGIGVSGHLTGLTPGQHGVHLHAVGQCTPPFESAGPHWNPSAKKHGTESGDGPHHGDMPNLTVGADGTVHVTVSAPAGSMLDSLMDADGASVVVHEKADDYKTDPSGDSGKRVACGVVKRP